MKELKAQLKEINSIREDLLFYYKGFVNKFTDLKKLPGIELDKESKKLYILGFRVTTSIHLPEGWIESKTAVLKISIRDETLYYEFDTSGKYIHEVYLENEESKELIRLDDQCWETTHQSEELLKYILKDIISLIG